MAPPLDKTGIARKNFDAFLRSYEAGHDQYILQAKKQNDYFLGFQWDPVDKAGVENKGRPALTLNEILQVILAVYGQYSVTRADVMFKPKRGGATTEVAEVLTRLMDQTMDANHYRHVENQVVLDGWIEDRGYFDVRMNFEQNMLGEVDIDSRDPREVVLDPDAKEYDPDTWNEVTTYVWKTPQDIEDMWGAEARKKAEAMAAADAGFGEKSVRFDTFGKDSASYFPGGERNIRSIRVIDRQYRRLQMVREFVDLTTGECRTIPESWPEDRVQAVAEGWGYFIRKRMKKVVWWTVSADTQLLHDGRSPYDFFTIVPYFPIFRRGRPSGLVRHQIDPQDQLNKVESQILHVINTTANSGWMVPSGGLINLTDQELEDRGAESGLVLVYNPNKDKPEKIKPNPVPSGLDRYAEKSRDYIKDIPGAAALLGARPPAKLADITLERAQQSAASTLQMPFDNLDLTRSILARNILRLFQTFYTEHRVYRVANWRNPEQPDEEVQINVPAVDGLLNDISLGEYDVKVSTAPARDSLEETAFAQAVLMREAGVQIPDHHVILNSNMPGKRQVAEEVKQQQGLGEPTEAQQMIQQIQIRAAMAEVQEMESKALMLQSQAMALQAKAQTQAASEQRETMEAVERLRLEQQRIQSSLYQAMAKLQNNLDLAAVHSQSKEALARYTQTNTTVNKERDRNAQINIESIRQLGSGRQSESSGAGTPRQAE